MRYLFVFFLFILFLIPAPAQQIQQNQSKAQLASTFYRNKEFAKSAELYLELHAKTNMAHYFDYYINSLIGLKEYSKAVKELRKQIRRTKNSNLEITLGFVYKEMGEPDKANDTYDKVINNLTKSKGVIVSIGNAFFNKRELEYAEKTYLKGREILEGEMFHSNLASIYAYLRDYNRMMIEYMALVKEDEKNVVILQSRLNSLLRYDFDNSLLSTIKKEVIKNIQADPEVIAFNRLLIWLFVIEKNYEQALINSIALDRRTKKEENNILKFAVNASNNKLYEIALEGLNYLKDRKPPITIINNIKQEIARVEYQQYIHTPPSDRTSSALLVETFDNTLADLGFTKETTGLAQTYAHFLAFYLGKPDDAIRILDQALETRSINNIQRSRLNTERADINVYNNNLWEATLQYAQIAEANRENSLGDEVKLKKAKLAYYLGDIIWAKGLLDALKASTSKLIANDAMELSLLISSNYDLDTIAEPIQQFALGDLYIFQNKDSLAFTTFDSILIQYPNHSLNDKILIRKAQISEMRFDYVATASYYEKIVTDFSYSTSADDALYKLAVLYETKLNNIEKAQELYKKILLDHPGSIYVMDARNRYRKLRGDFTGDQEITPYESQEFISN